MTIIRPLFTILLVLHLSACTLTGTQKTANTRDALATSTANTQQNNTFTFKRSSHPATLRHNQKAPERTINFYIRGLMQDLVSNLQFVNERTPVAVTSFVLLNSNLKKTSLLGQQIAEGLMHEIHKFGIPVIDFKTSRGISVNKEGDFVFSRNPKKLQLDLPIHYVFGGTMVKHQGGYLVNARVIGIDSKAVVASAQSFIPSDVSNALIDQKSTPSYKPKKTIKLVKGS